MNEHTPAIVFVVVTWWLSTGVMLRIVWLPRNTHRYSMAVFSVLAVLATLFIIGQSQVQTVEAAYFGFTAAIVVWAWHELAFLLGMISGPRKIACPPEARGWQRFRYATAAVIHHELALAFTAALLVVLTWDAPNQIATSTFLVLWIMRLSAKLNVFVGVRNLSEELMPPHMLYLGSYFRHARFAPLVPVSMVGAMFVLQALIGAAAVEASDFAIVGHTLVATLLGLAMLEHLFLAFPLPDTTLWRCFLRSKSSKAVSRTVRPARTDISVHSL